MLWKKILAYTVQSDKMFIIISLCKLFTDYVFENLIASLRIFIIISLIAKRYKHTVKNNRRFNFLIIEFIPVLSEWYYVFAIFNCHKITCCTKSYNFTVVCIYKLLVCVAADKFVKLCQRFSPFWLKFHAFAEIFV